jgi:hypothetical protein
MLSHAKTLNLHPNYVHATIFADSKHVTIGNSCVSRVTAIIAVTCWTDLGLHLRDTSSLPRPTAHCVESLLFGILQISYSFYVVGDAASKAAALVS